MIFGLKGDIVYSKNLKELNEYKNSYVICEDGISIGVFKDLPDKYKNIKIYNYENKLIIPGLVDLHLHAPQYQFIGINMDLELLEWLNKYTFNEEAKYENLEYAEKAYDIFVEKLKYSPTTRAVMFATIHKFATEYLFKKMEDSGVISYVGKVNQDRNSIPTLTEDTNDSIKNTHSMIEFAKDFNRTKFILTPRFTPSCTDCLLKSLGEIAKDENIPIQSHLCENISEINWVRELSPNSKNYADSYNIFGLFGNFTNTIMAHCIYLDDDEIDLIKNSKTFIAHCPSSNRNLSSGIAPISKYIDYNLKIGIGTDVAGGSYISMFRAIEDTITASKMRKVLLKDCDTFVSFNEAFFLATIGGGKFFGKVGSFDKGYEFDALVLDETNNPTTLFDELSLSQRLERFIYNPNNELINKFVYGKEIV